MSLPPCRYTESLAVPCDLSGGELGDGVLPATGFDSVLLIVAAVCVVVGGVLRKVFR